MTVINKKLIKEIDQYLHRLFPINRSITGPGNRESLHILQEIVPIEIKEYPSGLEVYDWVIPPEWRVRDAYIKNSKGVRLVDFQTSNIHLVSYSVPITKKMTFDELEPHLNIHQDLPDAIPYRTSYYKRDWGFSVTHDQFSALQQEKGELEVVIDSELNDNGSLTVGELIIHGETDKEILISSYICHPSLANDNLSGAVLTAFLARELIKGPKRHHSFRIVWVPETIGAIAYCAINEEVMKKIESGLVVTTVGGPGKFGYKQSFDNKHPINKAIEATFKDEGCDFITYPFDIHGSDERQYSSQGFRINTASITKNKYYEYPYYHTSLDNLDYVKAEHITDTLLLHVKVINKFEDIQSSHITNYSHLFYRNRYPNCEVMLSKHSLYPQIGGSIIPRIDEHDELDLILWLLFLCDGTLSLHEVAKKLEVPEQSLLPVIEKLLDKKILEDVSFSTKTQ